MHVPRYGFQDMVWKPSTLNCESWDVATHQVRVKTDIGCHFAIFNTREANRPPKLYTELSYEDYETESNITLVTNIQLVQVEIVL